MIAVRRLFRDIKRRTVSFQTVPSTPQQTLPMTGLNRSNSHEISLFEHYRHNKSNVLLIIYITLKIYTYSPYEFDQMLFNPLYYRIHISPENVKSIFLKLVIRFG